MKRPATTTHPTPQTQAVSQLLTTVKEKVLMEVIQLLPDLLWAGAVFSQLKVEQHVDLAAGQVGLQKENG